MHSYLLVAVPSSHVENLRRHADQPSGGRGYDVTEVSAKNILRRCPSDHRLFLLSDGAPDFCSCTFYHPPVTNQTLAQREHQYRKRGWSQAKIARALEQTEQSGRSLNKHKGLEPSTQKWLGDLVREVGKLHIVAIAKLANDSFDEIELPNENSINATELQNGKALIQPNELVRIVA